MVTTDEITAAIASSSEWLLVRDSHRSFPLFAAEIDISSAGGKSHFGFIDERGLHLWRLNDVRFDGAEIEFDVAGAFSKNRETMRLVPRTPASELTAEVEAARLARANEAATIVAGYLPGSRLGRVALNANNGRLAHINLDLANGSPLAAIADVTDAMTPEAVLAAAIVWLDKLGQRKAKPVFDIWVLCERRSVSTTRKLHALLRTVWKEKVTIVEIDRKPDPATLKPLPQRKLSDLWREKPPKLSRPARLAPDDLVNRLLCVAPDETDCIYSRHGVTVRYAGLPFARVRNIALSRRAWFGTDSVHALEEAADWKRLDTLVDDLRTYRSAATENNRHDLYRAAPEAWLEAILRRDITALDANLILSPIYNQFRSARDKIDLLALRRDGRLVVIELKTNPDRSAVLQAADYWRKIELQRRRGLLDDADLFDGRAIADKPAIIYIAAPAWSFHRDFDFFARALNPEIELWRFELHEDWRQKIKVVDRRNVNQT